MTTRAEELRQHVEQRVRHTVVSLAERFDWDLGDLRRRGQAVLRRVGHESERLARQDALPMPHLVRESLGRLNGLLAQLSPDDEGTMDAADHGDHDGEAFAVEAAHARASRGATSRPAAGAPEPAAGGGGRPAGSSRGKAGGRRRRHKSGGGHKES